MYRCPFYIMTSFKEKEKGRDWIMERKTTGVQRVKHPKHVWCGGRELEPQIPLPAPPSSAPAFPAHLSSHPSSGQHFLSSSPAPSSVDPTLCFQPLFTFQLVKIPPPSDSKPKWIQGPCYVILTPRQMP